MKHSHLNQGPSLAYCYQRCKLRHRRQNAQDCSAAAHLRSAWDNARNHCRRFHSERCRLCRSNLSMIRRQGRASNATLVTNFTRNDNLNRHTRLCSGLALSARRAFAYCLLSSILIFATNPSNAQGILNPPNLTPEFRHAAGLYPSVVNLASQAEITANATCGSQGAVKHCKLVEHVDRRTLRRNQQCSVCDSEGRVAERHPIHHAIDGRGKRWWQSPTIDQGYKYHWVTITLDLKQVFQIAYVIVKAANSPRPGNWILEKSLDGETWQPWQYFATSDRECFRVYNKTASRGAPRYSSDSEVTCTSYFSRLIPLENGEIHVSLIKGRPSADNPSTELITFTSARHIRLRLQKIRTLHGDLMTLSSISLKNRDPSVTRRYYYSIKDISIGGMCICYGHARNCPADPVTGLFKCACEHNTEGPNCERCAPGYQQYKWMPGNEDFQCEACNCHGHSDTCYYDEGVDERGESLNLSGEYSGGGVCTGCRDNTEGTNCQTCIDGYYRPLQVEPDDRNPCTACDCDPYGGVRASSHSGLYMCVKDVTSIDPEHNLYPGDCYCKEGFAGQRCDRCAFGYHGYPRCEPCLCSVAGSLNSDPCYGDCVCKANVRGNHCGQCKEGYYNLQRSNPDGCESCFCNGVTRHCTSADLKWSAVHTNHNWEVKDRRGRRRVEPQFDQELKEPFVEHEQTARSLGTAMYYWAAPNQYLGERLSSYGGTLRYTISYDILQGSEPLPIQAADVILQGNGKKLLYNYRGTLVYPQEETEIVIKLAENSNGHRDGWINEGTLVPATKEDMMAVLRNVLHMQIRAVYSRNLGAVYRIRDVYLQVATKDGDGAPVQSIEKCRCPAGYVGLSCGTCASGYWRRGNQCLSCNCNGHSDACNPLNGACVNCQHNTMGMHCERCKPGFYGDATSGGVDNCQMCSCPLPTASNNFSPTCYLDRTNGEMVCLQCPTGYAGKRCEICDQGYFGNPATPGGSCKPCQCNGNSFTCDKTTGMCIDCQHHTYGNHCEKCEPAYYGDAVSRKNCGPCECDPRGSLSRECHKDTGQCSCRRDVYGRKCDACASNYYLSTEERMCVRCACDSIGSVSMQCRSDGSCLCRKGVTGTLCDSCNRGYFGFSELGCIECNCPHTNGNCDVATGECMCPRNTYGDGCSQCEDGSFGLDEIDGCQLCNCSDIGAESSTCDKTTGQCQCKSQFTGKQCDQCRHGHYNYHDCQACDCNIAGTNATSCVEEDGVKLCQCLDDGQCNCKVNVIGKHCDQCASDSFSLTLDNEAGCTTCYCSGVTDRCTQALYVWGQPIALKSATIEISELQSFASTSSGHRSFTRMRNEEKYWNLPQRFRGDKLTSYGGKLQYTVHFVSEQHADMNFRPAIILRGGQPGNMNTIKYEEKSSPSRQNMPHVIPFHEKGWTHLNTMRRVNRVEFADILQDIEQFLIKVPYDGSMSDLRIRNVLLDVAQPGIFGRGDASSGTPLSLGIESCFCPPGYTGISCQDCANGFMRTQQGPDIGKCEACNCNNRSKICDAMSGDCLNCEGKFTGRNCGRCLPGYFVAGNVCKQCACPGNSLNNFSPTCHADGADGIDDYTCDACKIGYEGKHCERCSDGYYGDPTVPGGFCAKCVCNVAGSLDGVCDKRTGQCRCDAGISGRVCDQCMPRHVITPTGCRKCGDECSGKLLHELEVLTNTTVSVDVHSMFPPPWNRLITNRNLTMQIQPYIQLLLHRKLNYLTKQRLVVKEQIHDDLKEIMERFAQLTSLPNNASSFEMLISPLRLHAQSCASNMDELLTNARETEGMLDAQNTMIYSLSNVAEVWRRSVARLLNQLQNGSAEEVVAMRDKLAVWFDGMRARNFSQYQARADNELRSAQILLENMASNFTEQVTASGNTFNNTYQQLRNLVSDRHEILQTFQGLLTNASELVNVTHVTNDLNKQTLRQAASKVERVRNEAIINNVTLKEGQQLIDDAHTLLKKGRANLDSLQGLASSFLEQLDVLNRNVEIMMSTELHNLHQKKEIAYDYIKTEIEDTVNYIMGVHKNISDFSYNQTEAATRWTKIARRFDKANRSADLALISAQKALNTLTTDLKTRSKTSLTRSNGIHEETSGMQDFVTGDRNQLRDLDDALRSARQSTRNLTEHHEQIQTRLKDIKRRYSPSLADVTKSVDAAKKRLNVLKKELAKGQKKVVKLGKAEIDVNNRNQTRRNIQKNLDGIPITLRRAVDALESANRNKARVQLLSDSVQANITNIRKLIDDSKRKAAAIRRASVQSSGRCAMLYKPPLSSSKTTEIILNVNTYKSNNMLFYLAREKKDYFAVELRQGRVSVTWDLGSGPGFVENPVIVSSSETTSIPAQDNWFRIEVIRRNQDVNVTVYRVSDKAGTIQTRLGTSPGVFTMLDANSNDMLFVGGVFNTTQVNERVRYRTFTGCMGEAFLQGASIGLWSFKRIQNADDCKVCTESPEVYKQAMETNLYSYNGHSFSILPIVRERSTERSQLSMRFQTFSSEGLILYASSVRLPDYISLELHDGHLVLEMDTGDGARNATTETRYNFGDWVAISVVRNRNKALLSVTRSGQDQPEQIWLSMTNSSDGFLNLTQGDFLSVGGLPTDRTIKDYLKFTVRSGVTRTSFVGCLKEFVFEHTLTSLKSAGTGDIVRDSGVTASCPSEITRNIGIANGGYVKLKGINLEPSSSIAMTFNTLEPSAILLLGTSEAAGGARRRRQTVKSFYSLYLSGGRVHARLRLARGNEIRLVSPKRLYNNGHSHLVTLRRSGSNVTLQMNEEREIAFGLLENSEDELLLVRQLFVGGVPLSYNPRHATNTRKSLNGCVRDIIADNLVNFKSAVEAKNAHVGTCDFVNFAPKTTIAPVTPPRRISHDTAQVPSGHTTSTPMSYMSDNVPIRTANDSSCQSANHLSGFRNLTAHFGLSTNSYMRFDIRKDIAKKFSFQVKVRTFASSGLLLYGGHDTHVDFFSLKLKDGVPVFQFDNGMGVAEGVSKRAVNDGKWHRIKLKRSRRKGLLIVDGKKTKFRSRKGAKHMDIGNEVYVGGLPSYFNKKQQIGKISNSMDVCIKDLTLNKRTKFDLSRPTEQSDVSRCYKSVERGAHFLGSGYVTYSEKYRVGPDMLIEFEFRSWAANGVFLSVQDSERVDGLALEMINGSIYFRADNGGGSFETSFHFNISSKSTKRKRATAKSQFRLCNGDWHRVRAEKRKNSLLLMVNGEEAPTVTSLVGTMAADTKDPLYIGGVPENARPQTQLREGAKNFRGCIRNMTIKGSAVSFNDVAKRKNVYPDSCPKMR